MLTDKPISLRIYRLLFLLNLFIKILAQLTGMLYDGLVRLNYRLTHKTRSVGHVGMSGYFGYINRSNGASIGYSFAQTRTADFSRT
nr:MAG TPA: hypothetical protein [Caudoviricetes sp.]